MTQHSTITQDVFLKVAQVFNWATKEHYEMWFSNGQRSRRVEILLQRFTDRKKLIATTYGKRLVYIVPRYRKFDAFQIEHGLGVTEGLVRLILADKSGVIIPERKFFGHQVRPEFGIYYGDSMLLYEYCTRDNAKRLHVLKNKLRHYLEFTREKQLVLFVMQLGRPEVKDTLNKLRPEGPFLFTDYQTFTSVPLGEQLRAKIYLWEDGNEYSLKYDQLEPH